MATVRTNNRYGKKGWATVGGKRHYWRAEFERHWARYQQFLKEHNVIQDWFYEPKIFKFKGETHGAVQYCPDFKIIQNDGTVVWQECKGIHKGKTNTKFRKMQKYYPGVVMELVLQRYAKTEAAINLRKMAVKYSNK